MMSYRQTGLTPEFLEETQSTSESFIEWHMVNNMPRPQWRSKHFALMVYRQIILRYTAGYPIEDMKPLLTLYIQHAKRWSTSSHSTNDSEHTVYLHDEFANVY